MKRIMATYLSIIVICALIWNIIIGQMLYNHPLWVESDLGSHYEGNSVLIQGTEGYARLTMDSLGYNNDQTADKRKRLVLVLGDSHTEAMQVNRGNNFCSLSQTMLEDTTVYNMGVSGYSAAEYIHYGPNVVEKFHPDFVIIQIDVTDLVQEATSKKECHIEGSGDEYRIVTAPEPESAIRYLIDSIQPVRNIAMYLKVRLSGFVARLRNPREKPFLPEAKQQVVEANLPSASYTSLIGWEIDQLARIYKGRFAFLYIPVIPILGNDGIRQTEEADDASIKEDLIRICRQKNIDVIDMSDDFVREYENNKVFVRGFNNTEIGYGHLNAEGHRVIAEKLSAYLSGKIKSY